MLAIYIALWCIGCIVSTRTLNKNRTDIKLEYEELFGANGPIDNYLFLDDTEDMFVAHNGGSKSGLRFNRTLKHPNKKTNRKTAGGVEITIGQALKDFKNGDNMEIITRVAKILDFLLYNNNSNNVTTDAMFNQLNSLNDLGYEDEKISIRGKVLNYYFSQLIDEVYLKPIKSKKDEIKRLESGFTKESNEKKNYKRNYKFSNKKKIKMSDERKKRVKRSYVNYLGKTCYDRGVHGSYGNTTYLCSFCTYSVDYGEDVIPRYGNIVDCVEEDGGCLLGDGNCIQKVITTTFQTFFGFNYETQTEEWAIETYDINSSCECECTNGSVMSIVIN